MEPEFMLYRRRHMAELRPYVEGEDLTGVSISEEDKKAGSPKHGDMIARNPKNHNDQWLVSAQYFKDNFEHSGGSDVSQTKLDAKFYGIIRKVKDDTFVSPDEWMVFLAKDNAFAEVLLLYREACIRLGCDEEQIKLLNEAIERVNKWRADNPDKLKNPDAKGEFHLYHHLNLNKAPT